MQIDLSQNEIKLLDEALVAWTRIVISDAMGQVMLGTMLKAARKGDSQTPEDIGDEPKTIMSQANVVCASREHRALLLRAKLLQHSAVQSEHVTPEGSAL